MKLRQRIAGIVGAMLLSLGFVVAIASPAHADNPWLGPVRLIPGGSSKCLDVTGVSQANGALIQLYDCLPNQWNQQWYFYSSANCYQCFQIVPRHSWKCLDVVGASQATGAAIQQFDCLGPGQANQIWQLSYNSNGSYFQLAATHSWKALTYTGPPTNGAPVVQCCTLWLTWSSSLG